jgi:hypothetical protein
MLVKLSYCTFGSSVKNGCFSPLALLPVPILEEDGLTQSRVYKYHKSGIEIHFYYPSLFLPLVFMGISN